MRVALVAGVGAVVELSEAYRLAGTTVGGDRQLHVALGTGLPLEAAVNVQIEAVLTAVLKLLARTYVRFDRQLSVTLLACLGHFAGVVMLGEAGIAAELELSGGYASAGTNHRMAWQLLVASGALLGEVLQLLRVEGTVVRVEMEATAVAVFELTGLYSFACAGEGVRRQVFLALFALPPR